MHWAITVFIGEVVHKNLLHRGGRGDHFTFNSKNPDRSLVLKVRLSGFPTLFKCHPSNTVRALLNGHHFKIRLLCKIIPKSFGSVEDRRTLRENTQFNVDRTCKSTWDNHLEGNAGRNKGPKGHTLGPVLSPNGMGGQKTKKETTKFSLPAGTHLR